MAHIVFLAFLRNKEKNNNQRLRFQRNIHMPAKFLQTKSLNAINFINPLACKYPINHIFTANKKN